MPTCHRSSWCLASCVILFQQDVRLLHWLQVAYVNDGLEAIVFTADGDMRQALNNLQVSLLQTQRSDIMHADPDRSHCSCAAHGHKACNCIGRRQLDYAKVLGACTASGAIAPHCSSAGKLFGKRVKHGSCSMLSEALVQLATENGQMQLHSHLAARVLGFRIENMLRLGSMYEGWTASQQQPCL